MANKLQMQDWPYLKKYEKENANLPVLESGQKRIVFMGDSITEFWSALCPEFFVGNHTLTVALADKPRHKCSFASGLT